MQALAGCLGVLVVWCIAALACLPCLLLQLQRFADATRDLAVDAYTFAPLPLMCSPIAA